MTRSPRPRPQGLNESLMSLTEGEGPDQITLAQIVARLDDQARGILMVLFSLPNCLPGIPGTSAITGLPLVFLTLQMTLNRPPWLPAFIAGRSVSRARLGDVLLRAKPWLLRVEKLIHPRLAVLTGDPAERLVGFLGMVLAILIMLPIPFGNMAPALALIAFSLGFIGRDGVWVIAGLILSAAAGVVLSAAGWAAFMAILKVWNLAP